MDSELNRKLRKLMNKGALINGAPTAETFINTTDSLEQVSDNIGQPQSRANFQSLEAMLGLPDAANSNLDDIVRSGFGSSAITVNNDGSVLERLEGILTSLRASGLVGDVFFADSARPDDTGDGLTPATAKKTIDAAVNLCAADDGDVVVVFASTGVGFNENVNLGGVLLDIAGVRIIGMNSPQVENSNAGATAVFTVSAARCMIAGILVQETTNGIYGIACTSDYNTFANNLIRGDMSHGLYLNNADLNEVYDNRFIDMGQPLTAGVAIDGTSRNNRVYRNYIDNTDYALRVINAACDRNALIANVINGAAGGSARGISIEAGAQTSVVGNFIGQCVVTIVNAGTNTVIVDNHEVSQYTRAGDIPLTVEQEMSKWSKFFADGDGDGATGSQLPANKSLYDIIGAAYLDGGGGFGTDSVISDLGVINAAVAIIDTTQDKEPRVQEVIIYPVAEDAGTTELADDGTSPAYYPAVAASTVVVGEGNGVAAWSEDIPFEAEGTITIISIYAEFEWQSRFLVNGSDGLNSVSKIQMSRDGGASWVDITDNFTHNAAVMTNRIRAGVGSWVPTIVAGANQLRFRLLHWVDVGSGISASEAQIRSNSYVRITYIKS